MMKNFISRITSRRFIVYIVCTLIFLVTTKIPWEGYLTVSIVFIGQDALLKLIPTKKDNEDDQGN